MVNRTSGPFEFLTGSAVPPEWIEGEEEEFERILEGLWTRRTAVADFITNCRQARSSPFPNW